MTNGRFEEGKKMGVEKMVEVYDKNPGYWIDNRAVQRKKMGIKQMVEVKNAYENDGCWTNGSFDWRKKKKGLGMNGRSWRWKL